MDIIPACFYPTTICVLDDDDQYLDALEMTLASKKQNYLFRFFSDPHAALKYLNQQYDDSDLLRKWGEALDAELPDNHLIKIDFKDVARKSMDAQRFQATSIVVVDYDMPSMDGITFCKKLKNPYLQKIMATGAADESLAVLAFNGRVIDAFVGKHEAEFWTRVEAKIHCLQNLYFEKLTYPLHLSLKLKTKESYGYVLEDPVFISFFQQILLDYEVQEYYQLESSGSFLFFDNKGNHHVLFVYNKDKIKADQLEVSAILEEDLAPYLKQAILNEEKMFCYYDITTYDLPPVSEWHKYILDLKILEGSFGTYYYAFQSNYLSLDHLDQLGVHTFQDFCLKTPNEILRREGVHTS